MIARIELPYPYTYIAPADGSATVITGKHVPMLKPFVGMKLEITGANAGQYVVATYVPEVPGTLQPMRGRERLPACGPGP